MSGELVSPAAQTVEVPDHAVPPPESAHEANDASGHDNSLDNAPATVSGRIVATIMMINAAEVAESVDELYELARSDRGQAIWSNRVRAAFVTRRAALEREWVQAVDWAWGARPGPCSRCSSRWVNARGHGTQCARCVRACAHPEVSRVRGVKILRDGGHKPVYACRQCGGLIDARKGEPRGEHVFEDLRLGRPVSPCARCGRREGTQTHHWAPSAVFGSDAGHWPTSELCQECHRIWHRLMRRAGGYRLDHDERGTTLPSAAACHACGEITDRKDIKIGGLLHDRELCPPCAADEPFALNLQERG